MTDDVYRFTIRCYPEIVRRRDVTTREEAIAHQVCMTPLGCDDCREAFRSYMVRDEVWSATGLPKYGALLCMPCLQARIGRELTAGDFFDYPANDWFTR